MTPLPWTWDGGREDPRERILIRPPTTVREGTHGKKRSEREQVGRDDLSIASGSRHQGGPTCSGFRSKGSS